MYLNRKTARRHFNYSDSSEENNSENDEHNSDNSYSDEEESESVQSYRNNRSEHNSDNSYSNDEESKSVQSYRNNRSNRNHYESENNDDSSESEKSESNRSYSSNNNDYEIDEKSEEREGRFQKKVAFTSVFPFLRSKCDLPPKKIKQKNITERNELLTAQIISEEFYIGLSQIEPDGAYGAIESVGHKISNAILPIKEVIPPQFGKFFYHAFVWFKTIKGGLLAEYGPYRNTPKEIKEKGRVAHFFNLREFGIRFYSMSFEEFVEKTQILNDGLLLKDIRNFKVIGKKMIRKNLLEIFDSMGVNDYNYKWGALDYELLEHNCQDFVAKFLEGVCAVREKGDIFKGDHNLSKCFLPWKLLKVLEKNEGQSRILLEKLPLVGPVISGVRALGNRIEDIFS